MVLAPAEKNRARPVVPRRMGFEFSSELPRYWLADHRLSTILSNGINLLFPYAERFFIRSLRRNAERIHDPALRDRVTGFIGQEANHGWEHERFFDALDRQGYEVHAFLGWYEHWFGQRLEPLLSPTWALAVTAGLEHFSAIFGDAALRTGTLDEAHPDVRRLLLWHAAEEIEHKSVTFDVLRHVDSRYLVRVGGMLVATAGLATFWVAATRHLMRQDRRLDADRAQRARGVIRTLREAVDVTVRHTIWPRLIRSFGDYFRRDFHPDQHDNYELAERYLATLAEAG